MEPDRRRDRREARQQAKDTRVSLTTTPALPAAASRPSALPPNLAALFDQDAKVLVRFAKRLQAELGIPMPEVVRRTVNAWIRVTVPALDRFTSPT